MNIRHSWPLIVFFLVACDDNHSPPPLVVTSSHVSTDAIDMQLYGVTRYIEEALVTQLSVQLYTTDKYGFWQYVHLVGSDELWLNTPSQNQILTAELLPSDKDPAYVDYSADVSDSTADVELAVNLLRDTETVGEGKLTVLQETPFAVAYEGDGVSVNDSITASWEAVDGYDYRLIYRFSCAAADGSDIGFAVSWPRYYGEELTSPFTLDIDQYSSPPNDATDCKVSVTLKAVQEQSPEQTTEVRDIHVIAAREQAIIVPILWP